MSQSRLTIYARTDVGRVRTNNEDSFLISDLETGTCLPDSVKDVDVGNRGILMVVCDGMGGHAAGEVASALVVESLRSSLSDPMVDHSSQQRLIEQAVKKANADVYTAARDSDKRGMGATLTAVLFHGTDAYIAEVGDSRGYLLRSGRLRQLTRDQTFVQALVDAGVLTPEQARVSERKNVILQAMGKEKDVQVSIGRLSLRRDDRLLLCCDGITNMVTDAELETLLSTGDPAALCDRIIDLANERGGEDNLTVLLGVVEGDLQLPREDETVSHSLEVLQEYNPVTPSTRSSRPPVVRRTIAPVLVTGATGNTGREVCRSLYRLGIPFTAAVSNLSRAATILGQETRTVRLDLCDPSTWDAALVGMRGLFLLRPPAVANVKNTLNAFIDRAIAAGVEHIVFLSVDGADRQRWVPHRKVENHLIDSGVSITLLRPGFFAQNLIDAYLDDIRDRDEIVVPAGKGRVAFVDVRDLAELAARSFVEERLRGGAWSLTGSQTVDFYQVAEMLSGELKREIRYREAGIIAYARHLRKKRLPWMQILVQTILHLGIRRGNAAIISPSLPLLLGKDSLSLARFITDHRHYWIRERSGST